MPAREEDFLELVIASERLEAWLDVLRSDASQTRKHRALQELAQMVNEREAYAEEARVLGAVGVLTKLLSKTDDDAMCGMAADIIAVCSGHLACPGKWVSWVVSADDPSWAALVASVQAACQAAAATDTAQVLASELSQAFSQQMRVYEYGGIKMYIKEGALGDGLGARVWLVAHSLCRELVEHPEIVRGCDVLELGSGCGICGILAAQLGARNVTLTDYEDQVLLNLRSCFDPEDADECDDLDDFFGGEASAGGASTQASEAAAPSWDQDNMHICYLDWTDSVRHLELLGSTPVSSLCAKPRQPAAEEPDQGLPGADKGTDAQTPSRPSGLHPARQFEVIIGSDIVYEAAHAELVAAAVKHRLAPGGRCLLFSTVREEAIFQALFEQFKRRNLRAARHAVPAPKKEAGLAGQVLDYEGGFIMIVLEHEGAPATTWHRDDLLPSNNAHL
ncbi:hypothetical protein WJX72_011185 [[Myrmecia] bisecta]|uniref:Uncharacterized protein n=1 Tax=[Myrmecia] bisecta TaxID=41462 RepID=A0AAW1QSW6_9CHLO